MEAGWGLLAEDEAEEALDWELEAGESDPEVVQTMDWGEWEPTIEPRGLGGGETERAAQGLVVEAEGERGKLPPERDKDVREGGEAREAEGEGADKAMPPERDKEGGHKWEIHESVAPELRARVEALLTAHRAQFAFSMKELGRCTISTLTLELTTKEPVACKQRRLAQVEQEAARVQILEWLEAGVIRHSTSSYAAPITMPPKKDEHGNVTTYRLSGDFRGLNAVTRREKYPMPLPEEIFDRLAGKKYFSVLDLRSGFNQIPLAEADRHKTAFHGVGGHYEFNVMPFGLVNATAVFQRTMDRVLRGWRRMPPASWMTSSWPPTPWRSICSLSRRC